MNGKTTFLVIVLILLGIAGGYYLGANYKLTFQPKNAATTAAIPPLVGGDRDAHGCIPSAGYSWCEEKQKCLRSWEEACVATAGAGLVSPTIDETATIISAVRAGLIAGHGADAGKLNITVSKIAGNFAQGGASGTGGGGMWFAVKVSGVWKLVWDGNGTISCASVNPYNFPASMIPECWDDATQTNVKR